MLSLNSMNEQCRLAAAVVGCREVMNKNLAFMSKLSESSSKNMRAEMCREPRPHLLITTLIVMARNALRRNVSVKL